MSLRKNSIDGFYNRCEPDGGEITGSGPGFDRAMRKFKARQLRKSKVGRWRCGTNIRQNKNDGTFIDRDWAIIDF